MSLIDLWCMTERGLAPSKGFQAWMGILMSLSDTWKQTRMHGKSDCTPVTSLGLGELRKTKTEYTDVTLPYYSLAIWANDFFFFSICVLVTTLINFDYIIDLHKSEYNVVFLTFCHFKSINRKMKITNETKVQWSKESADATMNRHFSPHFLCSDTLQIH